MEISTFPKKTHMVLPFPSFTLYGLVRFFFYHTDQLDQLGDLESKGHLATCNFFSKMLRFVSNSSSFIYSDYADYLSLHSHILDDITKINECLFEKLYISLSNSHEIMDN